MAFLCDTCGKVYVYKRNLTRHMTVSHGGLEHYNCVIYGCGSTFIRRDYLKRHLMLHHGYDETTARECSLNACRADQQEDAYYENVSDDDSILDLIAEADGSAYNQEYNEILGQFNVNQLKDNSVNDKERYDISHWISDISDDDCVDSQGINDADSVSDRGGCNANSDSDTISLMSDVHDGLSGDELNTAHGNDELNKAHGNDELNKAHGNDELNTAHGNDELKKAHGNDELNTTHGSDDTNGNDNMEQGLDNDVDYPNDIIIIDSDDETAVEVSNMRTRKQTMTFTVTKITTYVNDTEISTDVYKDREYYEEFY